MRRLALWTILIAACSGCSGGYLLSATDGVAPAGGEAPMVVRLRHREFPFYKPIIKAAVLRFRLADGPIRAAHTDPDGYASVSLPAPAATGVFPLTVIYQDLEGNESTWQLRAFVWDPNRPVVAVDVSAITPGGQDAQAALARLAQQANIIYLTDRSVTTFPQLAQVLSASGLPEGPILSWGAEHWWQRRLNAWQWRDVRQGLWRIERIISPLGDLRTVFPGLRIGIAGSRLGVQAIQQAGMDCRVVTALAPKTGDVFEPISWADLAESGLPAPKPEPQPEPAPESP